MSSEMDYRAVRQRVEEGIKKQKKIARWVLFAVSIFMFILFLAIAWGNGGVQRNTDPTTGAMIMLSIGWWTAILFQFISLMLDTQLGERSIRERVIRHELFREMLESANAIGFHEKRKRVMQLTDDGELEAIAETADTADISSRQAKG